MAFGKKTDDGDPREEGLRILALVVIVIAAVAALAIFLVPRGSQLHMCQSIPLSGNKEQCLYSLALSSNNGSVCGLLTNPSMQQTCYLTIGESSNNTALCYKAGNESVAATCVDKIAGTTDAYSACDNLQNGYKDACVMQIAISQSNATPCNSLSSLNNRTICNSVINFGYGLKKGNPAYCGNVTKSYETNIVSAIVSQVDLLNYTKAYESLNYPVLMSEFLNSPSYSARDLCYMAIGVQYGNRTSCNEISNSTMSQDCVFELSQQNATANTTQSASFNYSELYGLCTAGGTQLGSSSCNDTLKIAEAVSTKNVSICASLPENFSYNCYAALASNYYNESYCSYITNITVNKACQEYMLINQSDILNQTQAFPSIK